LLQFVNLRLAAFLLVNCTAHPLTLGTVERFAAAAHDGLARKLAS
jgi:L-aminopeptidase/D-esterase-like protein